ncbi:MAG TPA: site-specific DNA-methyltransferase [Pyrinomonadaceae bacterium]|nr:site-specific DNA-methyltransferase [Pyrinomonadaceae bacterium]
MAKRNTPKKKLLRKSVETLMHDEASRKNIPTAEYQSVLQKEEERLVNVVLPRGSASLGEEKAQRNRDLDPQLVWRGKDEQDWSDLVVQAPPIYIQEKVHPKVLIDDLLRQTKPGDKSKDKESDQFDLFSDFNGLPSEDAKTEFYQHDAHWANRIILGDSLQVMTSLAEREGLRGKVQCIYIDPPYGIKFNSNFQWSTTSRDVKDGNLSHITREPEQVKAFRDTWRDGINSYLSYLRDRLIVARDLLAISGSIFVQIGDSNVHRVRAVMEEVFGEENFISEIHFLTTGGFETGKLANIADHILWFARNSAHTKYRQLWEEFSSSRQEAAYRWVKERPGIARSLKSSESFEFFQRSNARLFKPDNLISQGAANEDQPFEVGGRVFRPASNSHWKAKYPQGMQRLLHSERIYAAENSLRYVREITDFPVKARANVWDDTATGQFTDAKIYVVQTNVKIVERCVLMATDPSDLVLDPTCGSGTTAYVCEQWGRRWITIDTSRVALALGRARVMGARYPFYLLADSLEGQKKEAEVRESEPSSLPTNNDIRHGFVYERVPHITLKSIANNAEIDVIWEKFQEVLEPLRDRLNEEMGHHWEEWQVPHYAEDPWDSSTHKLFRDLRREQDEGDKADAKKLRDLVTAMNLNLKREYTLETLPTRPADPWPEQAQKLHTQWWEQRIARQREIDASIGAKAEFEYLYDKPYEDKKKVRVAGPFTVESLSPHRVLAVDQNDELIDTLRDSNNGDERDFIQKILDNLKVAGVQQAHKEDKINFTSLAPWPGHYISAEGRYHENDSNGDAEKRAAIFIGPEFGTVARPDLVSAAREAGDAGFDVLITCAFNYDAHSTEFSKLGRIPVLKARMNADLHMSDELKNTGKGNLFVIFGEPDIDILEAEGGQIQVKVNGVDVFHPNTGEVRSDGAEGIACWFIDTDYNEESFFVRHAYFLGANDPYKSLKTTLKAEINEEAWATLHSDTSRPFDKPESGRIAVKVINHLGDEVMKVFRF